MKALRDAAVRLLLVALGLRAAATIIEPLIPALVVVVSLLVVLWITLGRPGRL